MSADAKTLIEEAYKVASFFKSSDYCSSGSVGAALLTRDGNIYTGICIDSSCSLGFCAEHAAVAEMLKHRESEIVMIAAVNTQKKPGPPCGRCRELIYQVNPLNLNTRIILGEDKFILLKELLPYRWQEAWK